MTERMDSSSDRWQRHWIGKVSPLARRILGFNLTALGVLIGCILWTWDTDISSGLAGDLRLLSEAEVIAEVIETRFSEQSAGLNQQEIDAVLLDALRGLRLRKGLTVGLYSSDLIWLSGAKGSQPLLKFLEHRLGGSRRQFYHFSRWVRIFSPSVFSTAS
jgi:hypothetical protein